jgi:hypothetical protein
MLITFSSFAETKSDDEIIKNIEFFQNLELVKDSSKLMILPKEEIKKVKIEEAAALLPEGI